MRLIQQALNGQKTNKVPIWIMRQAGRYLPEYMQTRGEAGDFLSLCYNPELACEVTMQPIRRYDFDAAILFSDILVIPHALGQEVRFVQGEGPKLDALTSLEDIEKLDISRIHDHLAPVYETVERIRENLDDEKTLIGFCGAPWTVACYMLEGGGSKEFLKIKDFAFRHEEAFQKLIDILVESSSAYLLKQVEQGANVIQLFDSWAGVLDAQSFQKWVIEPNSQIVKNLRAVHPDLQIIGFARGAGEKVADFAKGTKVNGVGLDTSMDRQWAAREVQGEFCVQGNLDPAIMRAGGKILDEHVISILDDLSDGPFIFNGGHGVIKDTPPEHVARVVELVRNYR
jgi:uroporphyrinogen decarboxylase